MIKSKETICIELKPNLNTCIETLSKKEYEQTLNLLLKEGILDEELGDKLEALRLFLESANFAQLRGQYEGYLTNERKITFLIYYKERKMSYEWKVES